MKKIKISSLYVLIYAAVIIMLLYNFYIQKEEHQYNIDGLDIIATSSIEYPLLPKRIKSLDIKYKGLSFSISGAYPVSVVSDDNVIRNPGIDRINMNDKRLRIYLKDRVIINIRVDNLGERLTISSTIPKVFPRIKEITIPYILNDSYTIEQNELSYKISSPSEEFHLKMNEKYYIDRVKKRIHLLTEGDKISTLTFSSLSNDELPIAEQWYIGARKAEELPLDTLIDNFLIKVEQGINTVFNPMRYNRESELWQNIPGSNQYTENSAIVYLAQGLKHGNYSGRIFRLNELRSRYPSTFGFNSTPYLGNIVVNGKAGAKLNNKKLSEIKGIIKNSDAKILDIWIPEYYFKGQDIDLQLLEKAIYKSEKNDFTLNELAVNLNNLLHILDSGTSSSRISNSVKDISDLIIQRIKWDDTGLYLVNKEGLSYMELNFKVGRLLIEASQYESSKYSSPIGEALISTYLNNSDTKGRIKTTYNIDKREYSIGNINPEDSFIMLSDNPYLPHYFQSNGIKIWTISNAVEISSNSRNTRISISFPVDRSTPVNSHFLTISGIKPYKQLSFRGKPWRADRNFEKWGIGYYYDNISKLLYFMPDHTKSKEEIVVTY